MSGQASQNVMVEINKLVGKGVIKYTEHEKGEFISPIFFRSKSDGTRRLILNLKILNEFLEYNHFKMETIHSVADLIQPHCYMTTIDLKDAYYSVKISEEDSKYLKFYVGKNLLKFVVLPNGLSSGPRKFTKLTKPPIACLRIEGVIVAIYIDDIIVIGDTFEECLIGAIKTIKLFLKLGFIIHPEKSSLQPSQEITYLGFVFNSKEMLVTLTIEKREKILEPCKSFLKKDSFTIREFSSLIGTFTSTFPGNTFRLLYYRELDKCKTLGLKKAKGNFDTFIKLTKEAILDLQWWIKNLYTVSKKLQYPDITKVIYTDASMHGWGYTV